MTAGRRDHPATLVVLAKDPVPGRVKTRLCPPCTPIQAAALARAALLDTLDAAGAVAARRHVLALEGSGCAWRGRGFEVIPQRGEGLGERLAAAFTDCGGPAVVVGMDTPQLRPVDLEVALGRLFGDGVGAVLGPATDGGYWAIGLHRADPAVFAGVPMGTDRTGAAQLARLEALGLRVAPLPLARDVDRWDDVLHVASRAPRTRFAAAARKVARALAPVG